MSRTLALMTLTLVILGDFGQAFLLTEYLIGGFKTNVGEFPHMAALGRPPQRYPPATNANEGDSVEWFCGGTLISDRFVLTAAHCANSQMEDPPTVVRLGEYDLSTEDDSDHRDVAVAGIVHHPRYNSVQAYNDIALIRLNESVTFTQYIRPACLWQLETLPVEANGQLTAIGWGQLGQYGEQPSELHKVELPVVPSAMCNRLMSTPRTRRLKFGVLPSQICAGDLAGGKDTCEGDSGGPLFLKSSDPNFNYDVVGITSIGGICGTARKPGVYTRVSYYTNWIESVVWRKQ